MGLGCQFSGWYSLRISVPSNSQWIELKNTSGAEIKAAADAYKLVFYAPNETPPAKTAAVAATATALAKFLRQLPAGVTDRVGTITDAGAYWSIAGKGQSGRTGEGEAAAAVNCGCSDTGDHLDVSCSGCD